MPKDWRSAVIVPLYEVNGERTECKNYKGIHPVSSVGKNVCMYISIKHP